MSTIAAISTAAGNSGIGIIRLSGEKAFEILNKIFIPKNKNVPIKGYTIKYGNIVNPENNEILDEVLVSYFVSPKSYTKEDMCEINTHGGMVIERKILELCVSQGAEYAEPGEFTKRAFLNGRIDLTQAEAVIDLINAKSDRESASSIKILKGSLSKKLEVIRNELLDVMADIEASIDYPEYDIEEVTNDKLSAVLKSSKEKLISLKNTFERGKILKDGIKTSIIGKPNVGKSSLLNLLLNEERAIVSSVEGTTRDTIEEYINVKGIPLKIIDTAGIRTTNDEVEKIGVKKSINVIDVSELIILILDDSRKLNEDDLKILEMTKDKNVIILLNKVDLNKNYLVNNDEIKKYNKKIIEFSTVTEKGIDELYDAIVEIFNINDFDSENTEYITNLRQKEHITKAIKQIEDTEEKLKQELPIDIMSIYIKNILEEIGSITGENVSEDIINEIFSKFCLGK